MLDIDWKPNKKAPIPLYKQIAEYIKAKIATGQWPLHSRLPSQRELADRFAVNRSTLTTALEELVADGLLLSKAGSGIWVANNSWALYTKKNQVTWNSYLSSGMCLPNLPIIQEINRAEFLPGIIRLGTGELAPEFMPSELLGQVLHSLPGKISSLGYEEPKGLLQLREQICAYMKTLGVPASPSSVLIVSGALQALQLICFGLLPHGSAILLEKPSYLYSLTLFSSLRLRFNGLPLDSSGIQLASLEHHQTGQSSLLYTIPCFHNPTGITMSENRRNELVALCQNKQLSIIEDDVYRELWLDCPPPAPLKAREADGRILYVGSMSKALSPGLRIGWIIGPEPVINRLADLKMQNDYGSSSLSQWATAEWFASGCFARHTEAVRYSLRQRRAAMAAALEMHFADLATWTIPQGGFYVWLTLQQPVSLPKLFKTALQDGLLIHPGTLYDPLASNHLRLSYCYASVAQLTDGLKRLAGHIRKLSRQALP